MSKKSNLTVCSSCLEDFNTKELYIVNKPMRHGDISYGFYRTVYCEECVKKEETYHSIHSEPKKK